MRTGVTLMLLAALASPAAAAVIHDESVNGDLSSNAAAPTTVVLALGGNTITGSCHNIAPTPDVRDYITFTIPAGHELANLNLLAYAPDNLSFASFNVGATSFVPSAVTNGSFLTGIHIAGAQVGMDLMPAFVSASVTTNALAAPKLGAGTYSFLIQQTSAIVQQYSLEFVLIELGVPAQPTTWGAMKSLYR